MAERITRIKDFATARALECGSRIAVRNPRLLGSIAAGEQRVWWHASGTAAESVDWREFPGIITAGRVPRDYPNRVVLSTEPGALLDFAAERGGHMAAAYRLGETAVMTTILDHNNAEIHQVAASFGIGTGPLQAQLGAYIAGSREFHAVPDAVTLVGGRGLPNEAIARYYPQAQHL